MSTASRQAAYDSLPRDADDELYALADSIHDAVLAQVRTDLGRGVQMLLDEHQAGDDSVTLRAVLELVS